MSTFHISSSLDDILLVQLLMMLMGLRICVNSREKAEARSQGHPLPYFIELNYFLF